MASSEASVDAVIEFHEWFSAVHEAAWADAGAKQDSAIFAAVNAITKSETDIWGFLEKRHLAMG